MKKIGLDFGTTNSILSYFDPHQNNLKSFTLGGAGGSETIPSILSESKQDSDQSAIGNEAKLNLGDEDFNVYSHFKMMLAETDREALLIRGYNSKKNPKEVAGKYLNLLLSAYCEEQGIKGELDTLVITIPEIWAREENYAARESLKEICEHFAPLPKNVQMLSEPIAASAYFAHNYNVLNGKNFNGHILVCDYGGGTLDISLSEIREQQVTVLETTGLGTSSESLGVAGVAYDEAVVNRKAEHAQYNEMLGWSENLYYSALKDFEEQKITRKKAIDEAMELYLRDPKGCDYKLFKNERLNNVETTTRDLVEVFDALIHPALIKALQEMDQFLRIRKIDTSNSDIFRVVMVGGFSNFILVQKAIKEFFKFRTKGDKRFETCFSLTDTALAISKGAALVANEIVQINMTCPINVGFKFKRRYDEQIKEIDQIVLQKGVKISEYIDPVYWKQEQQEKEVKIYKSDPNQPFTIFVDVRSDLRKYRDLEKRLIEIVPNINKDDNRWKIGFSVSPDLTFHLHIKDQDGQEQKTSIGKLLETI